MDNEEKKPPEDKPYPIPAPDPLELREPPPMYYGDGGGDGRNAVAPKKGKRKKKAPGDLYVEVDVDDDEAWEAEMDRLGRIFRVQRGLPPDEPGFDLDNFEEDPKEIEAFFSKREAERDAKRKNDGGTEEVYYSSEEVERRFRQWALNELRQEIANGQE